MHVSYDIIMLQSQKSKQTKSSKYFGLFCCQPHRNQLNYYVKILMIWFIILEIIVSYPDLFLADPFGSVHHQLINFNLERPKLPHKIRNYVTKHFQSGWATLVVWKFLDCLRCLSGWPVIFIWIFKLFISAIQENAKLVITIMSHTFATLPFTDNFCQMAINKEPTLKPFP